MKRLLLVLCSIISITAFAQVQDPNSPGFDLGGTPSDTTAGQNPYETDGEQPAAGEVPPPKPYERIKLDVDSVTNLIVYSGVVEQEETSSDSLYARTKRWATKVFTKPVYDVDKKNQKVVINGSITAYSFNKYGKRPIGKFNFKMNVWLKEGRYKYTVTNLVHESEKSNSGEIKRNYFEYYYTTTTNIRTVDQILRFGDKELKEMIESYRKFMKDPVVVDEEDW